MLFIVLITLLMVPFSLCLPADIPGSIVTVNIRAVKALEAISALQQTVHRLDRQLDILQKYTEVISAARFGDLQKVRYHILTHSSRPTNSPFQLSEGCSVKSCNGSSVAYSHPDDDTICTCIHSSVIARHMLMATIEDHDMNSSKESIQMHKRFVEDMQPAVKDTNFTYIPPPQTDITPELLEESLTVQPQNTATVGSVLPYFQDGVISYGVQLNGFIAATMALNASTSLPCDSIGSSSEPDLVLKPAEVKNATAQPVIMDCEIIAVNMYDPNIITYWVQKRDGGIFSLAGSNKVEDINDINAAASTNLVLRAQAWGQTKRSEEHTCTPDCPHLITARALDRRTMSTPDVHTSTFSKEACDTITCNTNGGMSALFNPFTMTCGCPDQTYVETDMSGTG